MNKIEMFVAKLLGKKIKGNVNDNGEKIYYIPEHRLYKSVKPEKMFKTEDEAKVAGYREPKR